eukprot:contig_1036_g124
MDPSSIAGGTPVTSGSTSGTPSVEAWNQLTTFVTQMRDELEAHKVELEDTKQQLAETKAKAARENAKPARPNKPGLFSGKPGTIEAWCSHMDSYVRLSEPAEACRVACTYLDGEAFNWWHTYSQTTDVSSWDAFRAALIRRFSPLNKTQAARDKLHAWRQIKDVGTFNKTFLSVVVDIPDITEAEKIDRYTRGLKRDIWQALCLKNYTELEPLMTDALRVEAAKAGASRFTNNLSSTSGKPSATGVVPMDISSIKVEKLTPEERQRCMREGLCLRCREKGHLAKDCPKGQRN